MHGASGNEEGTRGMEMVQALVLVGGSATAFSLLGWATFATRFTWNKSGGLLFWKLRVYGCWSIGGSVYLTNK